MGVAQTVSLRSTRELVINRAQVEKPVLVRISGRLKIAQHLSAGNHQKIDQSVKRTAQGHVQGTMYQSKIQPSAKGGLEDSFDTDPGTQVLGYCQSSAMRTEQ